MPEVQAGVCKAELLRQGTAELHDPLLLHAALRHGGGIRGHTCGLGWSAGSGAEAWESLPGSQNPFGLQGLALGPECGAHSPTPASPAPVSAWLQGDRCWWGCESEDDPYAAEDLLMPAALWVVRPVRWGGLIVRPALTG